MPERLPNHVWVLRSETIFPDLRKYRPDELEKIIRQTLGNKEVNTIRVRYTGGIIYLYDEKSGKTKKREVPPEERDKWLGAWSGRKRKRDR